MIRSLGRRPYTIDGAHVVADDPYHVEIHNHLTRDDDPMTGEPPWFAQHKKDTDARFKAVHDALHEIGYSLRGYFGEGPGGSKVTGQVGAEDARSESELVQMKNYAGKMASKATTTSEKAKWNEEYDRADRELRQLRGADDEEGPGLGTRTGTGAPPQGEAPGSRKGNNPIWRTAALGSMSEQGEEMDGPLSPQHRYTGDAGLFSIASINRRALELRRTRTW
jgi:hypothetical protein